MTSQRLTEILDRARAKGRVSVRRSLFKLANAGNVAAAIFLSLVSVFWPAWEWIRFPERRWLYSSYAASLGIRDSVNCRRLIETKSVVPPSGK